MGIGGLGQGSEFARFIELTGTDGFVQLDDTAGELWQRFGTGGRSTFMFIDDDGSFVLTDYGVANEDRLIEEIERLSAT